MKGDYLMKLIGKKNLRIDDNHLGQHPGSALDRQEHTRLSASSILDVRGNMSVFPNRSHKSINEDF